jgi:hypothetical protein
MSSIEILCDPPSNCTCTAEPISPVNTGPQSNPARKFTAARLRLRPAPIAARVCRVDEGYRQKYGHSLRLTTSTFIESALCFFLATADAEGRPDCSFKRKPSYDENRKEGE